MRLTLQKSVTYDSSFFLIDVNKMSKSIMTSCHFIPENFFKVTTGCDKDKNKKEEKRTNKHKIR